MSKKEPKSLKVTVGLLAVLVIVLAGLVGYLYYENVRLRTEKATLYVIALPNAFTTRSPFNYTIFLINSNDFEVSYFPHLTVSLVSDIGKKLVYSRSIEFNMTSPFVLQPHAQRIIYSGMIALLPSVETGTYWLQATSTSTENITIFSQPIAINLY